MKNTKLLVGIFAFLSVFARGAFAVDPVEIEKLLKSTGVEGWIHGSVENRDLYVFTYRNPGNFFDYLNMSVPAQSLAAGAPLTVYAISRDQYSNFVANVAADTWSLVNVTGGGLTDPGGKSLSAV